MKINNDLYEYIYDNLYNITDIYLNKELINHYEYDNFNELIKEDDYRLNKTFKYTYDTEGNILNKKEYELNTENIINTNTYEYSNTSWEDQLTKFNNEVITYDAIGNPLTIGNKTLSWINGRQLNKYTYTDLEIDYEYNKDGIRTSKKINGEYTNYFTEGNKIIFETSTGNVIYYIRDEEGSLIGLKYNNTMYYYIKNMQEDIIGITDSNNNILCSYLYDSWGNIISIKDNNGYIITDESHIGIINPYRYRSYYYDKETKLYYLNSRYYNPEWGRFINADSYVYTAQDMHSTNMYVYTENNPICRTDTLGVFWFPVAGGIVGGATGFVVNGVCNVISGDNFFDGWLGSLTSGAYYGAMSTTSLSYTFTGQVAMNYGSAFINSSINGIGDMINGSYEPGDIIMNTIIDGTTSTIVTAPIKTNKNWIRPTKASTSFFGKYQQKLVTNQALTSIKSNFISQKVKMVYDYFKKKHNEELEKRFGKPAGGAGFGGGFSGNSGFNGSSGGRVF